MNDALGLRGFENGERSVGATEVGRSRATGRNRLTVAGTRTKEIMKPVIGWTEAARCPDILEAMHVNKRRTKPPP